MVTFLSELAERILIDTRYSLMETCIVLPNRRSGRMLQRELAKKIGKPFFSPAIITINDFIENLSPLKKLSDQELLIELFNLYTQYEQAEGKTFQSFISWGSTFLQDINDIDMQMADGESIFYNLGELRELQTTFGHDSLTANQQNYLRFYSVLPHLYREFHVFLQEKGYGYEGAIYKQTALQIEQLSSAYSYKRYVFAALGALSPAEQAIIKHYLFEYKAEIYFDFDTFYAEPLQPLLHSIKEGLGLSEIYKTGDYFATIPKKIIQAGTSGKIPQILFAIDRLHEIEKEQGNLDDTVLVLADESLILPFIHAYDCSEANLTMGYPLTETPAYGLLQSIINTIKNGVRFQEIQKNKEILYYHKDLMALFRNVVIKEYFFTEEAHVQYLDHLIAKNKIFYRPDDIPEPPNGALPIPMPLGKAFLDKLTAYFESLETLHPEENTFRPSIHIITQELKKIREILAPFYQEQDMDMQTLEFFILERMNKIAVPLKGEYGKGLQIMGLLETRAMDYRNVIILSVNEGILPAGRTQNSLILADIKRHYNLPSYQQKDRVYAYHFFRLLQRAENIFLVYNENSSDSLAEKSRLINQLEFEIKQQHLEDIISFQTCPVSVTPGQDHNSAIEISKNEEILRKLFTRSYSPSSLSQYIACPLKFYLSSLEKITLPETINEQIEQKVVGTILHHILEVVFREIKEKPSLYRETITNHLKRIDETVRHFFAMNSDIKGQELDQGRVFLYTEIVKQNLKNYLEQVLTEMEAHPFQVIGIENEFRTMMTIKENQFSFHGIADRVDLRQNEVMIMDYKTGKVDPAELKFESMEDLFTNPEKSKLFQLLMYAYLYHKSANEQGLPAMEWLSCGIVSFRELNRRGGLPLMLPSVPDEYGKLSERITSPILDEFEERLGLLIHEMTDPLFPFKQTDNLDICRFCDYLSICGR